MMFTTLGAIQGAEWRSGWLPGFFPRQVPCLVAVFRFRSLDNLAACWAAAV